MTSFDLRRLPRGDLQPDHLQYFMDNLRIIYYGHPLLQVLRSRFPSQVSIHVRYLSAIRAHLNLKYNLPFVPALPPLHSLELPPVDQQVPALTKATQIFSGSLCRDPLSQSDPALLLPVLYVYV